MARNGHGYDAWRMRARRTLRRRNARGKRGTPRWMLAAVGLAGVGAFLFIAAAIAGIFVYESYAADLVPPDQLAINEASQGAKILDRNGNLLYEYVDDRAGLRRPIALQDVSEAFLAATIATEDDSFFTNPGVNWKGLARAAWENSPFSGTDIFGGSGGSSITQQLVKNVYIPQEERQKRTIDRKLRETVYALELTQNYSKEQILEWYVNQISYGGVYNGVEAASQGYFGKHASELTLAEAALLAGIPQSPAEYDPVNNPEGALARRNAILDLMLRQGRIQVGHDKYYTVTREEVEAAKQEPINISQRRFPIEAPHFVLQYVQPQLEALFGREKLLRDGLVVTTTLDLDLQRRVQEIMEKHIQEFENISNSHNGAMMVMDPKTGEVLVMIGSRDYFNEEIEGKNNNALACNSPGSSFKPFAYLTTFLELGWGPGTVILDTPVTYKDALGREFTPRNPSSKFQGPITIRNALGNSLNIPANKAAAAVGPPKIVAEARKLGFVNTFRLASQGGCSASDTYGPAIATGGVSVTLEEMMFGYSVLANGGLMRGMAPIDPERAKERPVDPVAILKVTDAKGVTRFDIDKNRKEQRVVDPEYTYLIWDILSDPQAQCITFGCGGITIPGYRAGVKTGTSEPFEQGHRCAGKIGETWAFAYSPDLVVGIWAGNSNNDCVVNIYSTSISFRSVRDAFQAASAGKPVTPMQRPEGVVEAEVCVPSGLKPTPLCGRTTKDLFVKERLPKEEDTWWRRVQIDIRTGLIAQPGTPLQYIQEQVALVPPPEWLQTEEDKQAAQEWANALGIPLITDGGGLGVAIDPNSPAAIYLPRPGATVSGVVQVVGRARSPDFQRYRLEIGAGEDPKTWSHIVTSSDQIEAGVLANVDLSRLAPGDYVLRLVVEDRRRGDLVATTPLKIAAGGAPGSQPAPTPTPPLRP